MAPEVVEAAKTFASDMCVALVCAIATASCCTDVDVAKWNVWQWGSGMLLAASLPMSCTAVLPMERNKRSLQKLSRSGGGCHM